MGKALLRGKKSVQLAESERETETVSRSEVGRGRRKGTEKCRGSEALKVTARRCHSFKLAQGPSGERGWRGLKRMISNLIDGPTNLDLDSSYFH